MNIFVAKWPNGTISIVSADTNRHLYDILDTEGNPEEASIYELEPDNDGHFHLTTDIVKNKIKVGIDFESNCKLKLRKNIFNDMSWMVEIF